MHRICSTLKQQVFVHLPPLFAQQHRVAAAHGTCYSAAVGHQSSFHAVGTPQWHCCRSPLQQITSSWWLQPIWKILISQIGSFPQVGVNIKNVWNHHLDLILQKFRPNSDRQKPITSTTCKKSLNITILKVKNILAKKKTKLKLVS